MTQTMGPQWTAQPEPHEERRIDELASLYRIATLGASRSDEMQILHEVVRLVADLVACEKPLLFLLDSESDGFDVFGSGEEGERLSLSEPSIVRRIFHSGRGELVNDVLSDPDSSPMLADLLGARQVLVSPLEVGGHRLGVVAAVNSKRGAFVDGDLRMLTILADRAALAIENAKLRSGMKRQSQELTGLQRLSRLLASAETVEYAIGESVHILSDLLSTQRMAVMLYDEEQDALVAHPPVEGMPDEEISGLKVPMSVPSLAGTVYRTDTPLVSQDATKDAWVGDDLRDLLDARNLLVVPLTSGPRPIGVLLAVNTRKGQFDENDIRFTTLLGSRIGSVIEASQARERERALLQRLREADRTKTEFVSMLAHELNGPMTTIVGFGNTLRDQWDTLPEEKRSRFLDIVSKETDRLSRLVQDLLDVSRMEAGTLRYELEPLSLPDLVESILTVHPSLRADHLVTSSVPLDLPHVMGDRDRVRQVLLNLLTNATRYSPEGTEIEIFADPQEYEGERFIRVGVRDSGIGIASEDIDRLFSKFVMLPKPSWVKKGTGLGLFITKGIVEAHGGHIWVDSTKGEGSTFYFTLKVGPAGDDASASV